MSNNLYDQAIAEAKQLREMAEQNAKNKIIEAVTPRIKALIEAQILGEQEEPEDLDAEITGVDLSMMDDEMSGDSIPSSSEPPVDETPAEELLEPSEPADGMSTENEVGIASVTVNAQGDVNISVAEGRGKSRALENNTRTPLMSGRVNLMEKFVTVRRQAKRLDAMLHGLQFKKLNETQRTLIKKAYQELLSEALKSKRLLLQEGANKELTTSYKLMIKEIKEMTRRSSAIFRRLFEIDDTDEMKDEMRDESSHDEGMHEAEDEGMREEDEEMGGDDAAGGDVDVDAASSALEDLGSALGLDVEIESGEEGGDDDEEEGEEIDLEEWGMLESDEEDEEDEGMREADDEGDDEGDVDEVYEIDENVLRREIRRLRNLREEADAMADQFGGGDEEGDMFVDVDEEDLLNALEDELGDAPMPTVESRRLRRRQRAQSRRVVRENAQLKATNKKLQKQLNEMNLFSAKLLYVNKLMQNRNVTQKQQRAIVEALDNAKTIREAKFLYQGLAKSLVKKGSINESSNRQRLLSSSSKPTRSGSATLNEDAVASRWATLAGINK